MAVYSVFEPPARDRAAAEHAEGFAFVRDGFSWGAAVFGPLWMLRHRLWLGLALYVAVAVALMVAARYLPAPHNALGVVVFALAVLLGLEGPSLRRQKLRRRGWRDLGIVVGDDLEAAERRFFDTWVARQREQRAARPAPRASPPVGRGPPSGPEVIGLFPDPGSNR